jgi:penicillin-binding protein 1C
MEATREEWFVAGTQQAVFAIDSIAAIEDAASASGKKTSKNAAVAARVVPDTPAARITAPAAGTVIALDPDIPPASQRLQFVAGPAAAGADLRWRVGGQPLGKGARVAWMPWPGRHVVQLTDGQGRVLDEIRIEVRGAGVAAGVPKKSV